VGCATYKSDISTFKILAIIPERREHLEDIASGGRIIPKWTLEKLVMRAWIGFMWQRMRSNGRHL